MVGGLLLLGGNGGVVWSEQYVASGLVALLVATEPLWVALFDWARRGGRRPSRSTALGMLIGFGGVAILVDPTNAGGGTPWLPALVVLFAAGSWALGSIYSLRAPLPRSPLVATGAEMLTGGALLVVAGLLHGEAAAFDPAAVSTASLVGMGYLIVFGSLVGFSAYVWLLRVSTPSKASTYAFVNPVIAVLLGWLLAAEPLTPRVGVAAALVVAAVVLVTVGQRPARPCAAAPPAVAPTARGRSPGSLPNSPPTPTPAAPRRSPPAASRWPPSPSGPSRSRHGAEA